MRLFYALKNTRWRMFFKANGVRSWAEIKFTGFMENPCEPTLYGTWTGITNTGDFYYTCAIIDCRGLWGKLSTESRPNLAREKQESARQAIERFLDPACRCRVGFHWKCAIHQRWEN